MKALTWLLVPLVGIGIYWRAYLVGYDDAADFWSTYKREARVYRELYERAEADARVMNCTPLDDNYFLCERKPHAQR